AVLARHADRVRALLGKAGPVENQHAAAVGNSRAQTRSYSSGYGPPPATKLESRSRAPPAQVRWNLAMSKSCERPATHSALFLTWGPRRPVSFPVTLDETDRESFFSMGVLDALCTGRR